MIFGNGLYLSKYPRSYSFKIYMVLEVYLQNLRSSCLLFPAPSGRPSGGRHPLEIKYTYPSTLDHAFSEYNAVMGIYPQNNRKYLPTFSCTFGREMPFGNEIQLSKYPGSFSFRKYMVMGFYLQNPRGGCYFFPAPSGGRRPLEMRYTYPITLVHVVSGYIWLWKSISKTLEVIALFFPCTFSRETPFGNEIYIANQSGSCSFRIYGYGSLSPKP